MRNDFEKLVVSLCHAENVTCYEEYFLSEEGLQILQIADKSFFTLWARGFPVPNGIHPTFKKSELGSNFEMDLCIQLTMTTNLRDIFVDLVQGNETCIFSLNKQAATWNDITIQPNESILFECTEKSTHISKKLWQLERYFLLADSCGLPAPVAAGVVVSGSLEDFQSAVNSINKSVWSEGQATLKMFGLPVFIVYTPYRNLFTEVVDVKFAVSGLKTDLSDFRKNVNTRFDEMHKTIMWMISVEELKIMCLSRGLSVPFQSNKQFLIDMLTNSNDKAGRSSEDSCVFMEGEVEGTVEKGAVGEGAVEEGKDGTVGKGAKMDVEGRQRKLEFKLRDAKSASDSFAVGEDGGKLLMRESSAMQEDVTRTLTFKKTKTGFLASGSAPS